MPCPTCGHTLANMIPTAELAEELNVWHCPRCGTVKVEDSSATEPVVYVPKLVERCREFRCLKDFKDNPALAFVWNSYGLAESIHLLAERPAAP